MATMKTYRWTIWMGVFATLLLMATETIASHWRFFLHGKIQFPEAAGNVGGSDCWGWTAPDGTEYAFMGVRDGIAVVNAQTLQVITVVPGPTLNGSYYWRDIETYRHYAYAVAEETGTNQGISVIDLQYLPDSVHFIGSFPLNLSGAVTAHTVSIDTLKGYAYAEGNSTQPVRILSLADPENPTFVGFLGTVGASIHDMFGRNDTVFVAEGSAGTWSVWNAANKASPTMITRVTFTSPGYVHNVWVSEDRHYAATTEETSFKTVKIWDVSNLANIQRAGQMLGPSQLAHNAYYKGNFVFCSHYESGVVVFDVTNPAAPVQVADYDTYLPSSNPDYHGCWSTYPYTANGFVYTSDIEGWLTVLRFAQNSVPVLTPVDTQNVLEGSTTLLHIVSTDADTVDKPGLQLVGAPVWAVLFDSANGRSRLTLNPGNSDSGTASFKLIASDSYDADTEFVVVNVGNVNHPPVLTTGLAADSINSGQTFTLSLSATDPDGQAVFLSASGLKPYISFVDSGNGRGSLTFAPPCTTPTTTDSVLVIASDGAAADSELVVVTVLSRTLVKGDLNFDGMFTSADVVLTLNCVFLGLGFCCPELLDANCDSQLTPADVVIIINVTYLGDPFPC